MNFKFLSILFSCLLLNSCMKSCNTDSSSQKTSESQKVNLFIWGEYTSPEIFNAFEQKTGIKVIESNFASNEELLAKLQAGAEGYDLIIPSDYMVSVMKQLDLLEPLDKSKIPNFKNIDPTLLHRSYDSENKYSVPYSWTVAGLIYNRAKLNAPVSSYQDLFGRQDIVHRFSMLDDTREAIGAVLKSEGQSVNTIDDSHLQTMLKRFKDIKKGLREFNSSPVTLLEQGDVLAAQIYSNEALRLIARNKNFEFVLPGDGFTMAIDNMAIPKNSKNKDNALALIDFLLDKDINIQFAKELLTAPIVNGALEKLPEDMRQHPAIGKFFHIMTKAELIEDLGPNISKYDRLWTEIKAN